MKKLILFSALLFATTEYTAQVEQEWTERSPYPGAGRHHPVTLVFGQNAYLLTGTTNTRTINNDVFRYNAPADSWTQVNAFPGPARSFAYGDTLNGKGYMGFGLGPNNRFFDDLWEFDPENETWSELASCPCRGRRHPAFIAHQGKIFVGQGDNNVLGNMNDWWEYDIATDSWRELPDLPGPVRHHPFHFAIGDYVYTGMGHGNNNSSGQLQIYRDWYRWDPAEEEWTTMSNFPRQARVAGTQFSNRDKGYVLSGDGSNHGTMATGEFWEYDPATDSWEELPPHPGVSRWAPHSFVVGDTVYFTSGQVRNGNPNAGLYNDVWSFPLLTEPPVSVENPVQTAEQFRVYPNPANVEIRFKGGLIDNGPVEIDIFGISGNLVLSTYLSEARMNVESLSNGIYFIKLQEPGGTIKQSKFIKQ